MITLTYDTKLTELPKTCSVCLFSDFCDKRVANLTKRGGYEWRVAATRGRDKHCPLRVSE